MNTISSTTTVQPIVPVSNKEYGKGFDMFLQAKLKVNQGRNESQYYYDSADKKIKYMILSFANQNYPEMFNLDENKKFSVDDINQSFADFSEIQRKIIITVLNDLKSWTRNLPRYFSPHDCEERRIRKK